MGTACSLCDDTRMEDRALSPRVSNEPAQDSVSDQDNEINDTETAPQIDRSQTLPPQLIRLGTRTLAFEPRCNDCGGLYHIMDDPTGQYGGQGIICSLCSADKTKLLFQDFFYQCTDCQMNDLCTDCYHQQKNEKRQSNASKSVPYGAILKLQNIRNNTMFQQPMNIKHQSVPATIHNRRKFHSTNDITTMKKKSKHKNGVNKKNRKKMNVMMLNESVYENGVSDGIFCINDYSLFDKSNKNYQNNLESVINFISSSNQVTIVKLYNLNITDDFIIMLLNKLLYQLKNNLNYTIQELYFDNNNIGDTGFGELAKFIAMDNKIQIISLSGNKSNISVNVLDELVNSIEKNSTLRKFIYDGFTNPDHKTRIENVLEKNQGIDHNETNE